MMRKMANKKSTSQESLSGECASTQEVQGIIVDCDTILNDASVQGDESKEMHYIYLVRCSDDSLYCGWTTDLKTSNRCSQWTYPRRCKIYARTSSCDLGIC